MKRTLLISLLMCFGLSVIAQEEVAIEQTLSSNIRKLEVARGWMVNLAIDTTLTDSKIAIITDPEHEQQALETQLCELSHHTLYILDNKSMPRATAVEVTLNSPLSEIYLKEGAVLEMREWKIPEQKIDFFQEDFSTIHIQKVTSFNNRVSFYVSDGAGLQIDTLAGDKLNVTLRDAEFTYGVNELTEDFSVSKQEEKIWSNSFTMGLSFGVRPNQNPKTFDSPFHNDGVFDLGVPLITGFHVSDHWWINTGLRYDFYYRRMSHQLKQQDGTLVITDNQIPTTQHIIRNSYLSVPIIFSRVSKKNSDNSLDFDISVGRLLGAKFFTREPSTSLGDWTSRSAKDLFNPWKIEMGVSLNTNSLGIIHGVRVYVNLLPEYKKSIAPESFQRIGFEFRL